jgi:hypothetical protein
MSDITCSHSIPLWMFRMYSCLATMWVKNIGLWAMNIGQMWGCWEQHQRHMGTMGNKGVIYMGSMQYWFYLV